jgi:hypothetical protein
MKHKHSLLLFLLVTAIGTAPASEKIDAAKIVAIKKHAEGRIISWQGHAPIFDGYPFYDITLEWKQKRYGVRYESRTGFYPEDWTVGKEVQVQRERGGFRIFRGTEAVFVRQVNVNDCVPSTIPTPGMLPQVPCD